MPEATPGGIGASGGVHLPAARSAGLIVTELGDELVIYDERVRHIHRLNDVSAAVWRLCDGKRGVTEIAIGANAALGTRVDADAVALALSKLGDADLLMQAVAVPRTSRRKFVRRAAIVAPAVISITAPLASASASNGICDGNPEQPIDCRSNGTTEGMCCMKDARIGKCDLVGQCIVAA